MNARVYNLSVEKLLFFDIETVRKQEVLDVDSDEFSLYQYKMRDKVTGDLLESKDVVDLYNLNAALYPAHNKIVCISVAFVKNEVVYSKSFTGDQKDIITQFYTMLNKFAADKSEMIPCGYNIKQFDLPIVRMKAFECGVEVKLDNKYTDSGKTPWVLAEDIFDLMDAIKGTYYQGISLQECCMMFGVKSPKDDISGADVSNVYYSEGVDRIATYCSKDVIACIHLFLKIQGSDYQITEYVDKTEKPLTLMETIQKTGVITESQKVSLLENAKALTKKEKDACVVILRAATNDSAEYKEFYAQLLKVKKG